MNLVPRSEETLEDLRRAHHLDLKILPDDTLRAEFIVIREEWAHRRFHQVRRDQAVTLAGGDWIGGTAWLSDRLRAIEDEIRRRGRQR